jgi:O-antigen ligase
VTLGVISGFLNANRVDFLKRGLEICLAMAPLFLVTVRSWSSALLILCALACWLFLLFNQNPSDHCTTKTNRQKLLMCFVLMAPVLGVALSSWLRGSNVWPNYDSPSRFLIAIAIFVFATRQQINYAKYLQYTAPISLIITFLQQHLFTQPMLWGADRMATYFADPLVFGYTSMTLGLLSLTSIHLLGKDNLALVILKLLGAGIGLYLSVKSGSRTGWLAVPLVMVIVIYSRKLLTGRALHLLVLGLIGLLAFGAFGFSNMVQQRVLMGMNEVVNYSWQGMAPESSVGFRITFLRIASDMFAVSPWAGFGDNGYDLKSLPSPIYVYASPESIRLAFNAGFHNEMVSNAVRFGIGGLLSSALLFLAPLFIFIHHSASSSVIQRSNALLGLVFATCFFISSFSTEVFDLKYMASFYALTIAMLCASAITEPVQDVL